MGAESPNESKFAGISKLRPYHSVNCECRPYSFQRYPNLALKYVGIDRIIENMVKSVGEIESAYIIGDYAKGKDSGIIDLILIGKINHNILQQLIEKLINRRIRPMIFTKKEFKKLKKPLDIKHAFPILG